MKYQIKTLNNISKRGLKQLTDAYVVDGEGAEAPDGILVRSAKMHDMALPESLSFIGRAGAGVNNIPLERCAEAGIVVCNAPGANANAVKEMVATAMLISSRKVVEGIEWTKSLSGDTDIAAAVEKGKKQFAGPELYKKKMGVIGLGAIGVLVANMAVDFGMKVYGFDPFISIKHAWGLSRKVKRASSLETLFQNCDYISIHVPFMKETENYVNADLLKICKPGLRLINLARGGLVDEDALAEALESDRLAAYVTDFPSNKTFAMKHVINIPHLGASTPESEENCASMVIDSMREFLENGNIVNSVNYPDCSMGVCESAHRITVAHHNVPNMIAGVTAVLAKDNINIANMTNKNKGQFAYTMIDVDSEVTDQAMADLKAISGVTRVRLVK